MNCERWEERIALFAGGDLPPEEAAAVQAHVASCTGCLELLNGLRQSLELLREGHAEPIEQAHFAAVRARVMTQLESERRPWWRHAWVLGLTAAAVALLLWFRPQPVERLALSPLSAPPSPVVEKALDQPAGPVAIKVEVRTRRIRRKPALPLIAERPEAPTESMKIKLLTDDPNVIIYWITDTKGE